MRQVGSTRLGGLAGRLAASAIAVATCLGAIGCANINVDLTGFRQFWANPGDETTAPEKGSPGTTTSTPQK